MMPPNDPAIQSERLSALLRDMLDIYSPSGKEEELSDFLWEYLAGYGLAVRKQTVDENRCNLLISTGRRTPRTLFMGHIDTVPAFDIEHYGCQIRNGTCYGLGAADMKSGCAALVEAFLTAAQADALPDRAMLALVVGEEETGDGTRVLLEEYAFDEALVAEPTDLLPCLEHYGYVEMNVRVLGDRRHAALSGRDTHAIRAMLRFLLRLEDHIERLEPDTVINIRDLHSSESGFAVPDRCAASIDFHIPPGMESAGYAADLDSFAVRELSKGGVLRYELEFPTLADGYRMAAEDRVSRGLQTVYAECGGAWRPVAFKSHSDANLLWEAGCRPLIFGPGLLAKAHTRDECVAMDQVREAAQIYARLLAGME